MRSLLRPLWLVLFCSPALARRGGSSRPSAGGSSSGGSAGGGLVLDPVIAAIFSFAIIFFFMTFTQSIFLLYCIVKSRKFQLPVKAKLGPFFSISLLFSTVALTLAYALHALFWAMTRNKVKDYRVNLPVPFLNAWNALEFLADIFLLSALFSLASHREKSTLKVSPNQRNVKMVVEALLVILLLGLGAGYLIARTFNSQISEHFYITFTFFLVMAALYLTVSSSVMYIQTRRSGSTDKIFSRIAFIISPCFFVHAIYLVIAEIIQLAGLATKISPGVDLTGLLISGITEFTALTVCLLFIPRKPTQPSCSEVPATDSSSDKP
ncbi:hypothetical protein P691DRAFT_779834 [Macrolepiota fuliginosa MF-IS2]|uniref:Uncharacterized protein n=1 Tax=Macrolepiota fuliginosa MF-IS2 TaxID=1400762 RepID=A0A9P5X0G7_9AGAR|nr:hypothetical protein P691DRAFT_779834 [Macrolepiota fuliginosa MF-IS2]